MEEKENEERKNNVQNKFWIPQKSVNSRNQDSRGRVVKHLFNSIALTNIVLRQLCTLWVQFLFKADSIKSDFVMFWKPDPPLMISLLHSLDLGVHTLFWWCLSHSWNTEYRSPLLSSLLRTVFPLDDPFDKI